MFRENYQSPSYRDNLRPERPVIEDPNRTDAEIALDYKESRGFMVEDLREAVYDRTLIGYLLAEDKEAFLKEHKLSEYEKSLIDGGRIPKINLLIDIDGVLIDTQSELKKIIKVMTSRLNLVKSTKEVLESAKDSKIPFDILKILLTARDQASEVHLVTDRPSYGPECFPCFGKKSLQPLEDHGLEVRTNVSKKFTDGRELVPTIERNDIAYYIGSSDADHIYVKKIRAAMEKNKIKDESGRAEESPVPLEKLKYLEVRPSGRTKNIL